jgi:hypothetical protein
MAKTEEKIRRVLGTGNQSDRNLQRAVHAQRIGIWFYKTAIKNLTEESEIKFNKSTKCWALSPLLSPSVFEEKS